MNYRQFVVESQDPRPARPINTINNYAQILQKASFVSGFYTGAVLGLGYHQQSTKDLETLENVSFKEAKIKIKLYFEEYHGEVIEYSDLIEKLKIPLPVIVEACNELEEEGKIAPVD